MTSINITENERRIQYEATAGQTIFPYDFPIYETGDITVKKTPAAGGDDVTLVYPTDYTLSGLGAEAGGNVTLTSGATEDDVYTLLGTLPYERDQENFQTNGDFFADDVNEQLNKVTIMTQQLNRDLSLTLRVPDTTQSDADFTIPEPEALTFFRWNADASALELVDASQFTGTLLPNDPDDATYVRYNASGAIYDAKTATEVAADVAPTFAANAISGAAVNVDATFADRVGTNMTSTGADSLAGDFSDGVIDQAVIDKSTLPAFSATMSSSQAGATGDGTAATVQFDTEIDDQGGDFNTSTYTFTAPETGIYAFTVALRMDSIVVANTTGQVRIVTSNRNYTYVFVTNGYSGNGFGKENTALCVDMDAGDTAYIELVVAGNASANVEIDAGGGEQSFFHGYKVA